MNRIARTLAWLVLALGALVARAQAPGVDECLDCHADRELSAAFEDGASMPLFVDRGAYSASVHGARACVDCHDDVDLDRHPDKRLTTRRAYLVERSASCARCHGKASREFVSSVHGGALRGEPAPDVPTCVDCHATHRTAKAREPRFHLGAMDLCARCHTDAERMARHGLSTDVLRTYLQDFHGVTVTYTRREGRPEGTLSATCTDCHGTHSIAGKGSKGSLAMKANLVQACRKCHAAATESFSSAWLSHYVPSWDKTPLVFTVRLFYWIFIPFVLSGLVVLIGLDLRRVLLGRAHRFARGGPRVRRFGWARVAEHFLVIATFTTLVVTGLPQKFSESGWAESLILALGGLETVRILHRAAGIVFAVQASLHVAINVIGLLRGWMKPDMVPTRKDFTDAVASVRHAIDPSVPAPRFGRYDHRQKFEYWGMLVGAGVMVATGFLLYFPQWFAAWLPGVLIPVAKVAHSNEAMMAFLVITVWHFYCAHLAPEVFPVDTSMFTGKITEARNEAEHPLAGEGTCVDRAPEPVSSGGGSGIQASE